MLLLCSAAPLAGQQYPSDATYEVVVAQDVMVPMRDGVRLATDVYRPALDGEPVGTPFPTLLSRTPYGKDGADAEARYFASRGYVVVVQDVRGRYRSEGTFYVYLNEGLDGYDTVEWAAAQPWATGAVGTYGSSYLAATQMALAVENPPNLKAMFVRVGTSNYWEDGAGSGGAFYLLHNLDYALSLASTSKEVDEKPFLRGVLDYRSGAGQPVERLGDWFRQYPFGPNTGPLQSVRSYQQWFQDWVDHQSYDDYWKQNGYTFELYYDRVPDVPVYFVGGWYDIFLRGTLRNFAGLDSLHSSPIRMMIGPWQHSVGPSVTGDVDFGASAARDLRLEQLLWFDQVLKGRETGILERPAVEMFVMGGGDGTRSPEGRLRHGGHWATAEEWPPRAAEQVPVYLQADGGLSVVPPADTARPAVYTFDPTDPVPTIGGKIASGRDLVPPGPFDQRCVKGVVFGCDDDLPLSSRRDVLVFETEPLVEDVTVSGSVSVRLWVSSSAIDTDFTAKLIDVYPPSADFPEGYDMLIADRIVRMRYRNSLESASLMQPGEVYEVEIDLLGAANTFREGHRLRVDISSSNFPFFDVNPNTGEHLGRHTYLLPAVNSVYRDRQRASHIVLPVVSGRLP
ncbi:MAG: CocE/NonD family hydrolase [Dehalococcoidia bacterium]